MFLPAIAGAVRSLLYWKGVLAPHAREKATFWRRAGCERGLRPPMRAMEARARSEVTVVPSAPIGKLMVTIAVPIGHAEANDP